MISPLVSTQSRHASQDNIQTGNLVTVNLVDLQNTSKFVQCSARVERLTACTIFVKLVGLTIPVGYEIGDQIPLNWGKLVDW